MSVFTVSTSSIWAIEHGSKCFHTQFFLSKKSLDPISINHYETMKLDMSNSIYYDWNKKKHEGKRVLTAKSISKHFWAKTFFIPMHFEVEKKMFLREKLHLLC